MGASGWSYRTPYQPDVEAALHQLREQVFARGEFHKPWEMIGWSYQQFASQAEDEYGEFGDDEPDDGPAILRLFGGSRPAAEAPADAGRGPRDGPASIDELLRVNAESGTHSIIDIMGIADEPDFGAATPVPDDVLVKSFGTTEPTVEQVPAGHASYPRTLARLVEDLERWQAIYFIVYKDGRPHEVVFEGCSGD
jgi:hypothetical protein